MPLPKMIEVVPFTKQQLAAFKSTKAEIVIPGSKSITNRAIVLAAMSEGTVTLNGALWSEDTEAMSDCMQKLGIKTVVEPDPKVAANRIITVTGCGGKIPLGGTEEAPLELFVANAGTAARFLTAMVCLGEVGFVYRLSGVPRMHERPQKELIRALRALGCTHRPPRHLHIIIWRPNLVALIPLGSRAYSCLLLPTLAAAGRWAGCWAGHSLPLPSLPSIPTLAAAWPAAGLATRSLCARRERPTRRPQPPPSLTALALAPPSPCRPRRHSQRQAPRRRPRRRTQARPHCGLSRRLLTVCVGAPALVAPRRLGGVHPRGVQPGRAALCRDD